MVTSRSLGILRVIQLYRLCKLGGKLWRAVYDYDASVPETLSFKKYDYVEMIDDRLVKVREWRVI